MIGTDYIGSCKSNETYYHSHDGPSIIYKHLKKLKVFVGDQSKNVINLLESNTNHKIVI